MVFLFVAICVALVFWRYKHFACPYRLYMIFGKKGSGKSSYLTKLALRYSRKGWTVYTNMDDMIVPGVRLIDAQQLGEFVPVEHSVVLLDEVGMLYDNRNYKDFRPAVRDFFKLQRHYKCIVFLASQSFDIDKKLRDLTDEMFLCTSVGPVGIVRPIIKKIALTDASSLGESRIVDNLRFRCLFSWRFTWLPRYAAFFQSFVLPEHNYLPYTEPMLQPKPCFARFSPLHAIQLFFSKHKNTQV